MIASPPAKVAVNDCTTQRTKTVIKKSLAGMPIAVCLLLFQAACGGGTNPAQIHPPGADAQPPALSATENMRADAAPTATKTGKVTIKVTWPNLAPKLRRPTISRACGRSLSPPVRIHTLGGVSDAIVILEEQTTPLRPPETTTTTVLRDCALTPSIMVGRIGSILEIATLSDARHEFEIEKIGEPDTVLSRFGLPLIGQSYQLRMPDPGIFRIRTTGKNHTQAHFIVTRSSLFGTTNERGAVHFDAVPLGTYTITVVHPPLPNKTSLPRASATLDVELAKTNEVTIPLQR